MGECRRGGSAVHRRATPLPTLTDVDGFIHPLYPHVDPCQLLYEEERSAPATAGEAGRGLGEHRSEREHKEDGDVRR